MQKKFGKFRKIKRSQFRINKGNIQNLPNEKYCTLINSENSKVQLQIPLD